MAQGAESISVIKNDDGRYVSAKALETQWGIAIKKLPGSSQVVACREDRCVLVRKTTEVDGDLRVEVVGLAKAMGFKLVWSDSGDEVGFGKEAGEPAEVASNGVTGVGQLAPNFELPLLDGGTISLADLRGKRVLINSWASW